jgi:uncharacterized protein YdhG (YjbR/CyaY superfamily)
MKKASSRKGGGAARSKPKSVDAYLASVPEPARSTLNRVRAAIRSAVPKETIEVISYGIPGFRHKRMLVWYAAFADHCSLFPTASVIAKFKDELKPYRISKGTVQFPVDKPLPASLLKRMVKMRITQIESR